MPQTTPESPQRDEAVRLLQSTVATSMGQNSVDTLHPDFRAQIAQVVDLIIAAATPGKHSDQTAEATVKPEHEPASRKKHAGRKEGEN